MRVHLSSDEVNLLVHRYLLENGFLHSAFAFSAEAAIPKNPFHVAHAEKLPPNALVTLLQKALLFIYIEYHTEDETGRPIPCEETFSFFKRHECWTRREASGDELSSLVGAGAALGADAARGAGDREPPLGTPRNANSFQLTQFAAKLREGAHQHAAATGNSGSSGGSGAPAPVPPLEPEGFAEDGGLGADRGASALRGRRGTSVAGGAGPRGKKRARAHYRGGPAGAAGGSGADTPDLLLSGSSQAAASLSVEVERKAASLGEAEGCAASSVAAESDGGGASNSALGAYSAVDVAEGQIYVGLPRHACEEKVAVKNFIRLLPGQDGDSGALSEWSPVDPCLIVTNFAAGSPWLYRLPSLEISGPGALAPWRELAGPRVAGALNPGSSAHWKSDGELVATGYESGDVLVWHPTEPVCVASLAVSRTSVICTAFSPDGHFLAAACADGAVVIWELRRRDKSAKKLREPVRAGEDRDGESGGKTPAADGAKKREHAEAADARDDFEFVRVHAYRHRGERLHARATPPSSMPERPARSLSCLCAARYPAPRQPRVALSLSLSLGGAGGAAPSLQTVTTPLACAARSAENEKKKVKREKEDSTGGAAASPRSKKGEEETELEVGALPAFPARSAEEEEEKSKNGAGVNATAELAESSEAEVASLRWNASGTLLAIVDSSPVVKLWQLDDPQAPLIELSAHTEPVIKAEWRDGGPNDTQEFLVTVAMDRQLLLWDLAFSKEAPTKSVAYNYPPTSLRISGDGSRLAVGTYDSVVHVYSLPSLTEVASIIDPHMVIPHITWRSTHDSIAYNVFNMGRTIVVMADEKAEDENAE
ncbi:transducin beta-like protein TBL1 [Besnoitia besnoiti]|uniref:Transducin beta-like protein TBL1 n=1 Tax=Besnoitia besnoiti TaxID=94643 RepID=A0A2A9MEU8_BESBE|nr:transducin beta-like protein TBL1 [Besnoitia besnoiti]PFH33912.1 transducin beta-like protein TBL1 [Besnoitia besnoiti]